MTDAAERAPGATPASKISEFVRGWPVLLGATVAVSLGIPALPVYTNGVFVRPLEAAFGWARADIALASTASILAIALVSPFLGGLADRVGVRVLASLGLIFVGLGYLALSQMAGGVWLFIALQVGLAVLGACASPITVTRVVNVWFDRGKGLALGLTMAGIGATAAVAPGAVAAIIAEQGWRAAYGALAIAAFAAVPIVFITLRQADRPRPADIDADWAQEGCSVREAVSQGIFWRLTFAFLFLALAVSGFVLHLAPMLQDGGASAQSAASALGVLGLSVLAGRLTVGFLVDYVFAPLLTAVMLVIAAGGVLALALGGPGFAVPAALALGFALGAEVDLIAYLTARYFGLRFYGRLYGLQYAAFLVGSGLSPFVIAAIADRFGYPLALGLSSATLVGVAVLFLTAPRFPKTGKAHAR